MAPAYPLYEKDNAVFLQLRIQPRSSGPRLGGIVNDRLKLHISAPPIDGKANKECCAYIAKLLHIKKSAITIIRGKTVNNKTIKITGISAQNIRAILGI